LLGEDQQVEQEDIGASTTMAELVQSEAQPRFVGGGANGPVAVANDDMLQVHFYEEGGPHTTKFDHQDAAGLPVHDSPMELDPTTEDVPIEHHHRYVAHDQTGVVAGPNRSNHDIGLEFDLLV
jgi:hypothetical protein